MISVIRLCNTESECSVKSFMLEAVQLEPSAAIMWGLVISERWQVFEMQMPAELQSQQNLQRAGVCQTSRNTPKVHNYSAS